MARIAQPGSGEWRHSLFDCCGDCGDCCCAYFCFPCYAYSTTKATGEGFCCAALTCCFPPLLCCVRGNVRSARGIDGSVISDCFASWCCLCCAAVQMRREFTD